MADTTIFRIDAEKSTDVIKAKNNKALLLFSLAITLIAIFYSFILKQAGLQYLCLAGTAAMGTIAFFYFRNRLDPISQHIWNSYQLEVNSTGVIETMDKPHFSEFRHQLSWSTRRQEIKWGNMIVEENKIATLIDNINSSPLSRALFGEGAIVILNEIQNRDDLLILVRQHLQNHRKQMEHPASKS
jgi:hypothetical protein